MLQRDSFRQTIRVPLTYLSLGSNLGDRAANLRAAVRRLARLGTVRKISSFYETEPVEVTDQPWFVNCVVALEFNGSPQNLLQHALTIEQEMGRQRSRTKGPRTVDIDILLYGDRIIDEPGLRIPHPAMQGRRFVLEPLVEIAPEAFHPVLKKTAREMLACLQPGQVVRRLAEDDAGESRELGRKRREPRAE